MIAGIGQSGFCDGFVPMAAGSSLHIRKNESKWGGSGQSGMRARARDPDGVGKKDYWLCMSVGGGRATWKAGQPSLIHISCHIGLLQPYRYCGVLPEGPE